ncbi:unnamed protein product [Bemisia tabaci]|uniref:RRM domain-containing protein n=1 Tax=Bemisia tabaci TaxID=7038 RepID=A0A9P0F396_BEMTA|nr:unnamed protein product [Bemisia tabaci]
MKGSPEDKPDPDYIKMFVGQIPHSMDEEDLTKMFSEFGRVHQINVHRDKTTGQSKVDRERSKALDGFHLFIPSHSVSRASP